MLQHLRRTLQKSHPVELDVEAKSAQSGSSEIQTRTLRSKIKAPQIENNVERIMSSVARLSSSSVNDLQGLVSELQQLLDFLKSEVGRVESEIERTGRN